jgi:hypothetical protein
MLLARITLVALFLVLSVGCLEGTNQSGDGAGLKTLRSKAERGDAESQVALGKALINPMLPRSSSWPIAWPTDRGFKKI